MTRSSPAADRQSPASATAAASSALPASAPLGFKTKSMFGIGSLGEALGLFSVTSYALIYYNQVLGLRADLVGIALFASLLLDGPCDLFMGFVSDRWRSRLGRRHPFMYVAPIPIALSLFALFNPPAGLGAAGLFTWLLVSVIALRQFMNVFHTPHSALGGELSRDYHERSKVMAWASFSTAVGASLQAWIALTFFFVATPAFPFGVLNPAPYPYYSATIASLVLLTLYMSAWYTRDRIPFLPVPPADQPPFSIRAFYRDVAKAFSNRNYTMLIIGYFCLTMTNGLRQGLSLYVGTYFWKLQSSELRWLFLASTIGSLVAFVVTARLHKRFDKKATIVAASVVQALLPAVPSSLGLLGIIGPDTPGLLALLVVCSSIGWVGYGVLTIGVLSAMADVADENELRYGIRQEGVMYAMRNMFGKIDQAIGALLSGLIITWLAFPIGAKVGEVPRTALVGVTLSESVLAAIPGLCAIIPYLFYSINRASNARTKAAIVARQAAAGRAAAPPM